MSSRVAACCGLAITIIAVSVLLDLCGERKCIAAAPPAFFVVPTSGIDASVGKRVYFNAFDKGPPGPEWSSAEISRTRKGARPYLGDFVPGKPVTLTLGGLPPHKSLRISFDLFLQRSWDGSSSTWGATRWDLELGDGRTLIHTSFCNCGFFVDNNEQAFPDTYPARPHPAWTGAAENQCLGLMQSWGGPNRTFDASSVYHLVLTIPHTGNDVLFRFFSTTKTDQKKYFGLTNVQVDALNELPSHSDAELTALWNELGSALPLVAFKAQWELIASGDAAARFLNQHLAENIDLRDGEIRKLVDQQRAAGKEAFDGAVFESLKIQGRLTRRAVAEKLATGGLTPEFQDRLQELGALSERFPETATELRLQRAKLVFDVIGAPTVGWENIVRAHTNGVSDDFAIAQRLQALFPSLFADPPPIDAN